MKIALITFPALALSSPDMSAFLATSHFQDPVFECWALNATPQHAVEFITSLEMQWRRTPVDLLIFPADALADELATRLAWRIGAGSVCQALHWDESTHSATKASWGNALIATLTCPQGAVCLSVARRGASGAAPAMPPYTLTRDISPVSLPSDMTLLSTATQASGAPLTYATRVVAFGQGGANTDEENRLARTLAAEVGYTRQRVMLGKCDESRMVGVSGQLIAPELCIVAGASGAPAFCAGIRQSQFIVAINNDPDAPVFAQADVGIVAEWQPALEALAQCYAQAVS